MNQITIAKAAEHFLEAHILRDFDQMKELWTGLRLCLPGHNWPREQRRRAEILDRMQAINTVEALQRRAGGYPPGHGL